MIPMYLGIPENNSDSEHDVTMETLNIQSCV